MLRYWLGLSEAEIAATLGISQGRVKSTAARALPLEGTSHAALVADIVRRRPRRRGRDMCWAPGSSPVSTVLAPRCGGTLNGVFAEQVISLGFREVRKARP